MDSQSFAMSLICQEINQINPAKNNTKRVTEKKAAIIEENRQTFSKKSFIGISKIAINTEIKIGKSMFRPKYKMVKRANKLDKIKNSLA